MLRARTSTDTALLNAITSPAIELRDGDVYRAALDIAGDRTASVAARVFAFRTLVWTLEPGGMIQYADLADEMVVGRRICNRHGAHFHLRLTRGSPVPGDYVQVIHNLGRATENDSTAPRQVRRAAECARRQGPLDLTGR
jgi:hypothetical protein